MAEYPKLRQTTYPRRSSSRSVLHRRLDGQGHVYQARYKSFPVETDEHFYQVVRYVERNPLRANLVSDLGNWRWSSLWRRKAGDVAHRLLLADWPLPCPADWPAQVAAPQSEVELTAIRRSVLRGKPYGNRTWVEKTALELGLESTLRPR